MKKKQPYKYKLKFPAPSNIPAHQIIDLLAEEVQGNLYGYIEYDGTVRDRDACLRIHCYQAAIAILMPYCSDPAKLDPTLAPFRKMPNAKCSMPNARMKQKKGSQ